MSFAFGGLIIKKASALTDRRLLEVLEMKTLKYSHETTTQYAASRELEGVGILHWDDTVFVFGRDIPYSCSFNTTKPSKFDRQLAEMSSEHSSLCYMLNGTSESYGYAFFDGGKMVRGRSVSSGEQLSDTGKITPFDENVKMNESGMIHLIENFTGIPFSKLIGEGRSMVKIFENNLT
jgi:hypothetical protein